MLFTIDLLLIAPISIMVLGQKEVNYSTIPAIATAAYTTCKMILATKNALQAKKNNNLSLKRIINEPKRGIGKTSIDNIQEISENNHISMYEIIKNAQQYGLTRVYANSRDFIEVMEELILKSIDEIKPFLQRDGGDIEFVELTPENIVKVRLKGACNGCPGAQLTLQSVVERIVKEAVPEVAGIEAV